MRGDVLRRELLAEGFDFQGSRIPLLNPQGIFKPRILAAPLSITTVPNSPYRDDLSGRTLRYAYRGTDPQHRDNRGLRFAMEHRLALVYLYGLRPGEYMAAFPAYVVGDRVNELFFDVAIDDLHAATAVGEGSVVAENRAEIRREYVTSAVRRRLHQQAFRARVLDAYRTRCAFCRLRHQELLDAAHITADAHPDGAPLVSNGLSLCKLHHAAFDRHFLTVRPDYVIQVRASMLEEEDGPMLLHGLKEMHGRQIIVPSSEAQRPDPARLEERYQVFRATQS